MDKYTGILVLEQILNREEQPTYTLIIKASSNETYLPSEVDASAFDPGTDPTLKEVVITVTDQNDNPPYFPREFTAGKMLERILSFRLEVWNAPLEPLNLPPPPF